MNRAIGYVRVSTEKQADGGVSLEAQEQKIRAMAVVKDVELVDVIVDAGESAKSLQRPGMARLLELVDRKAVDTVIIAKLDRLTRSVVDLGELLTRFKKRGVTLVSVADSLDTRTATGRMVMNVMMSIAQWEREAISERTQDALSAKRSKNERIGNVAFGYRLSADGIHVERDELEQAILARIRTMKAAGRTLRQIADDLNIAGIRTRRQSAWRHQYVANALRDADSVTLANAA